VYIFDRISLNSEEHRLRVFENRVLRGIFEPERDEVTGEWRKLHNEELHGLYSLSNIIRVIEMEKNEIGGACNSVGGGERVYRVLVGKPERERERERKKERKKEREHLGNPGIDGRLILRWIFRSWMWGYGLD
jgi:hypothetical protein